ncbi:adaptor protein [Exiguobacterium sp. KRL4]|uniref:adaptor protein MecA n=1 Tax=Exiguobacterium sp. KRL4 TaxID=1914536 RepID=UPI0008F81E53|nr:adaptor protein MecA [Exiguobacterium sp. KRL4]OIN67953.1 adaptor protein [Exiguobacterium sp. KRL4]
MRFEQFKQGHLRVFVSKQELSVHDVRPETLAVGKGQALLRNLLEEAESNYGFHAVGTLDFFVTFFPNDGMLVDVRRDGVMPEETFEEFDQVEIRMTVDIVHHVLYQLDKFEDVIQASHGLVRHIKQTETGGALYFFEGRYYLYFQEQMKQQVEQTMTTILSEYGTPSPKSPLVMAEYGKVIMSEDAITTITTTFTP